MYKNSKNIIICYSNKNDFWCLHNCMPIKSHKRVTNKYPICWQKRKPEKYWVTDLGGIRWEI